eukprot:920289-Rhodomonas_salina.2
MARSPYAPAMRCPIDEACEAYRPVAKRGTSRISLRASYALSGTKLGRASIGLRVAMQRSVLTSAMLLPGAILYFVVADLRFLPTLRNQIQEPHVCQSH